jgi:hypothetical protein
MRLGRLESRSVVLPPSQQAVQIRVDLVNHNLPVAIMDLIPEAEIVGVAQELAEAHCRREITDVKVPQTRRPEGPLGHARENLTQ